MENKIKKSIADAFVDYGEIKASKPHKAYMAISTSIPEIGKNYRCRRLEKYSDGTLYFNSIETTIVQEIKILSSNVFMVTTLNSYYITYLLFFPTRNVHFALVDNKPQIDSPLHCCKLEFQNERCNCINWTTTDVQEIKKFYGLYKVKTCNSTYFCFPLTAN